MFRRIGIGLPFASLQPCTPPPASRRSTVLGRGIPVPAPSGPAQAPVLTVPVPTRPAPPAQQAPCQPAPQSAPNVDPADKVEERLENFQVFMLRATKASEATNLTSLRANLELALIQVHRCPPPATESVAVELACVSEQLTTMLASVSASFQAASQPASLPSASL